MFRMKATFNKQTAQVLARIMYPDDRRLEINDVITDSKPDADRYLIRHDAGVRVISRKELVEYALGRNIISIKVGRKTLRLRDQLK